jgi:uncharacterized membrane protein YjgN (DUF898 family)
MIYDVDPLRCPVVVTMSFLVTLGIYIPWAYAKIGRWLLEATYYEEGAATA